MHKTRILRKRILLADDEPGVRASIKLLLRLDEHTVSEACNGREALDRFAQEQFDLVITDMEMPLMKGNELAMQIKRLVPAQPILMLTAYAEHLGPSETPADAVLSKPFSFEDLRRTITRLLS